MACEDIQQRLDEARAALHRLETGAQVVVIVDAFRSRVEYTPAKKPDLIAYIQRLQAEHSVCMAQSGGQNGRPVVLTKPIQFIF